MSEINSLWDLNPVTLQPPQQYEQYLETGPQYDLGGILPGAKRVVINDYLAAGQMYVTEGEIILSKIGWEGLLAYLDRQQYVRQQVTRILEREMGDVLEWLREAGHEV